MFRPTLVGESLPHTEAQLTTDPGSVRGAVPSEHPRKCPERSISGCRAPPDLTHLITAFPRSSSQKRTPAGHGRGRRTSQDCSWLLDNAPLDAC